MDRLIEGYEAERERIRRDLALAQGQRRDYQARLGGGFAPAEYLEALTALRRQLEAALSETLSPDVPSTDALIARFTVLRQAHTVDAAPERTSERRATGLEEAVTPRILRSREVAGTTPLASSPTPVTTADVGVVKAPMPHPRRPAPSHRRRAAADERQLCLW